MIRPVFVMVIIIHLLIVSAAMIPGAASAAEADYEIKKTALGIYGGRAWPRGAFENEIEPGYCAGLFFDFPIDFFRNRSLFGEVEFSYRNHCFAESASSTFSRYTAGAGLLFRYPLFPRLRPFAALHAEMNYFNINAVITEKREKTFKAGASIRAGLNIPLYGELAMDTGIGLSASELSGKNYRDITCFAGVSWSFGFVRERNIEKITGKIEMERLYESGTASLKEGDGTAAMGYFRQVYLRDSDYGDVRRYMNIIEDSRKKHAEALELIEKKDLFGALSLLAEVQGTLLEAKEKAGELRKELLVLEAEYERKGIDAFNGNEMGKAIFYFKRIVLVNPDNESAKLYLPRAEKRYRAMKKMR